MFTVDLVGIVEDGGTPSATVPGNARQTLRIPVGSNVRIRLSVFNRSGSPVELAAGDAITLSAKMRPIQADSDLLGKTAVLVPDDGPNRADFVLVPADTADLPSRLVFDVRLKTAGGQQAPIVPTSPMVVERGTGAVS